MRAAGRIAQVMVACALLGARVAAADEPPSPRQACVTAYEEGQRLQRRASLRAAREQLLICSRDPCPKVLQQECIGWVADVDRSMPTVIVGARWNDGRDAADVRVLVDGQLLTSHLDGKPLDVDPGDHLFRFEPVGGLPTEERVVVRETEKARILTVSLGARDVVAAHPPALGKPMTVVAPDPSRPANGGVPAAAVALGGVGLAAAGSFTYFAIVGWSRQHHELGACSPACSPSQIDSVRADYILADASLAVSLVALGVGGFLLVSRHSAGAAPAAGVSVGLAPAQLWLQGFF